MKGQPNTAYLSNNSDLQHIKFYEIYYQGFLKKRKCSILNHFQYGNSKYMLFSELDTGRKAPQNAFKNAF